jgi:DNA-binding CsgD family transcriptional regulator
MPQRDEQLVGRAAELEALERSLAELDRRQACAVQLLGEPGIGKTRMLAELAARADARGHVVLEGSASELERELPFHVFVDALDDYVHALEPRRLDLIDDDARAELAQLLPSFPAAAADGAAREGERYRTHRAMRQLLEALAATKPLVLLLDDLHWADEGSVELLGALLRRPPAAAVLIGLAVRPRQLPERLSGALDRAGRAGTLTRIELGQLSAAEAGELLGESAGRTDLAVLYEASGGNPFYLQQLARSPRPAAAAGGAGIALGDSEVPGAVAAALTEELALLPRDARRLLEGAAVAGDPFEPDLAAAAAALPDEAAMDALDELLARDLIRHTDVPRRFRFRHPLVRGAAYETAPGGWRLSAHERCAELLAERGAPAVERAHHVERSARHGDAAAIAVLREAAHGVEARSPATAARLYGAAAQLVSPGAPERVELLAALAGAHAAAGQWHDARAAMLEALDLLPADALPLRIQVTAGAAGLENLLGMHEEAHNRLVQALDGLSDQGSAEAGTLMSQLAIDGFYRMDYETMGAWARRARDVAESLGDPCQTASAACILALALASAGADDALEVATAAAALLEDLSDEQLAGILQHGADGLAGAQLYLGLLAEAEALTERSLALARATGRGQLLPVLYWAGTSRLLSGRLREAADLFDTAVEIAQLYGHDEGIGWNLYSRSLTATAAGDVETALTTGEEAVEVLRGVDAGFPRAVAGAALAAALLAAGEAARATEELLSAAGGDELPRLPEGWRTGGFELLTRCWLAVGRPEEAARAAMLAEASAARFGLPLGRAWAERAAAAVALDAGDAATAAERALASAAAAGEAGAPIESALARLLGGRALAQAGESQRAAAELERAAAEFDARGAVRHRDAAERELRRLGVRNLHRRTRPGKADGDGVASLTERELQVARLVVDRRTNPQIAAELFLSQKTVETHMRNLFHKLGVSSRVEVARAVERADRELGDLGGAR